VFTLNFLSALIPWSQPCRAGDIESPGPARRFRRRGTGREQGVQRRPVTTPGGARYEVRHESSHRWINFPIRGISVPIFCCALCGYLKRVSPRVPARAESPDVGVLPCPAGRHSVTVCLSIRAVCQCRNFNHRVLNRFLSVWRNL
jgi:hypothetical protein